MKKTITLMIILFVITVFAVFANDSKWEYMVVSFGPTSFSPFSSKTMAYWDDGISIAAMGGSIENDLDILGQHGWEVISIVGTIGGDQQFILKREVDSKRTATEHTEIIKNSITMINNYEEIISNYNNSKRLVDLDAIEEAQNSENVKKSQHETVEIPIKEYINSIGIKPYRIEFTWNDQKKTVLIQAYYDVTKDYLIEGTNNYRRKSVLDYLSSIAKQLSEFPQKEYLDGFELKATITIDGTRFDAGNVIYNYSKFGYWFQYSSN